MRAFDQLKAAKKAKQANDKIKETIQTYAENTVRKEIELSMLGLKKYIDTELKKLKGK